MVLQSSISPEGKLDIETPIGQMKPAKTVKYQFEKGDEQEVVPIFGTFRLFTFAACKTEKIRSERWIKTEKFST